MYPRPYLTTWFVDTDGEFFSNVYKEAMRQNIEATCEPCIVDIISAEESPTR